MLSDYLFITPLIGLVGLVLLVRSFPNILPSRQLFGIATFILSIFYISWRISNTLYDPRLKTPDFVFIGVFFVTEILTIINQNILAFMFLRTRDNTSLADQSESKFRSMPSEGFPAVDVLIPTYNESLDVLERTVLCAKAIDWPNHKVWVLDDGRRDWLRAWCERHDVSYLTRPDNQGAKAGNINAALARTNAPFILVLDADFVPTKNILRRMIGLFDDPRVGIVQTPHAFFNPDPVQQNLYATAFVPNEQRFFFDVVQPARDAWDAAFCCGSNGIIRRAALEHLGGKLPTESITEDLLLTLKLLRHGYVTRYLTEKLAFGLASESLTGFFIQRSRWARGAIQTLFLKDGPLGPGLSLIHRILFLANPLYWLSFTLNHVMAILAPIVFMMTGYVPIANVSWEEVVFFQMPIITYFIVYGRIVGGGKIHPVLSCVVNTFMAFRLMPVVAMAFVRPFGEGFRVTPKGREARSGRGDRSVRIMAGLAIMLLMLGLILNSDPGTRIIQTQGLIPVTLFWSLWNLLILALVMVVAEGVPARRQYDRFDTRSEPVVLIAETGRLQARLKNLSEGGVLLEGVPERSLPTRIQLEMAEVPAIDVELLPPRADGQPGRFVNLTEEAREQIIQKLFSGRYQPALAEETLGQVTMRLMLQAIRKTK